jgi:cell division protein FtsI (penicillin-binding protein 3)
MLYNAIANDGKMVRPYLVNSIKNNGITVKEFSSEVIDENLCKPEVIAAAKECMEAVVTEGTAKAVFADVPFAVAGKTGTSHVTDGKLKYQGGVYQASFVGYFPADKPEYTCIVVIKTKPHAALHYGGQLAAPVFKEVATKLYAMYVQRKNVVPVQYKSDSLFSVYAGSTNDVQNIFNSMDVSYKDSADKKQWSSVYVNPEKPVVKSSFVSKKLIPDVRNMSLKDALYILENMNVKVTTKGRGKVVAQDIMPGSQVLKNQNIMLLLN